jgi:hypothetical protein
LGRPESPEQYELPTELPDGLSVDETLAKDWFKEAHAMGLNRQQAARAVRFQVDTIANLQRTQSATQTQAAETALADLKAEWGTSFDEKSQLARTAMTRLEEGGAKGLSDVIPPDKLHEYPALARAMAMIGKYMSADEILGRGSRAEFSHSPGEARTILNQKRGDDDFMRAVRDTGHPNHTAASAEYEKLIYSANYTEAGTRRAITTPAG